MKRLRVAEAAERSGVPQGTLRYWRATGVGPPSYKIGKSVFYDVDELDVWLDAQKSASLQVGGSVG